MKSPEGMPGGAGPGEVTAISICFSIHYGGMVPVKGKTRSHLNFESRPVRFMVVASLYRRSEKLLWDA
jgi:hypothetical protein